MNPIESATNIATLEITINGRKIVVEESATIFEAARRLGIEIPALCHRPDLGMNPVAVCRACMVDVGDKKTYAAACARPCGTLRDEKTGEIKGVVTDSPAVEAARKTLIELLLSEHPRPCRRHLESLDCELELLGEKYGLLESLRAKKSPENKHPSKLESIALADDYGKLSSLFHREPDRPIDISNFCIAVDHSACILCDRCVRACNDIAENDVIGRIGKGMEASIGFDSDKPMGDSTCVNCGWCMVACPTGALVYSGEQRTGGFADALSVEDMQQLPFVRDAKVSASFLRRYQGGVRVRSFKKGEIIFRQRERGHTAFYIDSGKVDIYLETSAPVQECAKGVLPRLLELFQPRRATVHAASHAPSHASGRRAVSVDAGIDLPSDTLLTQLPDSQSMASRLFGEASCRNGQVRSATVRAAEDTIVLEMQRDILDLLLRSPRFRDDFNRINRRRLIDNYLRVSPLFSSISSKDLQWLEDRTQIVSFATGQIIFKINDPPDAFYLVRLGHVKVEKNGDVLNYLTRGQFFGEMSLLVEGALRGMNCVALDNVELLRIGKSDFDELLARNPAIRQELLRVKKIREESNAARFGAHDTKRSHDLQQYLNQELFEGQSLLLIDLDRCTRCDECVRACAQSHNGVARMVRDGQRFGKYLVPTACRSCHDPKCLGGCPVDAIHRTQDGGLAIVVEDHCIGCGFCFGEDADGNQTGTGCPYGNIFPVPVTETDPKTGEQSQWRKASVCDLDNCRGEKEEPSCVYACPHDAAMRVNGHDFFGAKLLEAPAAESDEKK